MRSTEQLRYATYFKKVAIDGVIAVKAGEFKGKYNMHVVAAYIVAAAHLESATVISDDPDFKRIKDIEALTETEFYQKLKTE